MRTHTLKTAPAFELIYTIVSPGQEQTFDQEGMDPGIEISGIRFYGSRLNDARVNYMLSVHEDAWTQEIIEALKREKYDGHYTD